MRGTCFRELEGTETPMNPSPTLHPHPQELEHLSASQIRRIQTLPGDHRLVRVRGRAPIVCLPDGELLRIGPSGRLLPECPVAPVRSYLHVAG
jgi:hypothetical protein